MESAYGWTTVFDKIHNTDMAIAHTLSCLTKM